MNYNISNFFFSFDFSVSGCSVRFLADTNYGRKNSINFGMVNKKREKKLIKEEPNLTIYPFAIEDLKNPPLIPKTTKTTNKIVQIEKTVKSVAIANPEKSAQNDKLREKSTEIYKKAEEIVNNNHI